jgi:serine/threonine-protein kinase RsbW
MQLSIPSELAQVRYLGLAVRALLAELSCPEEQAASIELCLIEAVNNVIEHAYREEPGHLVEVSVCADAEAIELAVRDDGAVMPDGVIERARAREAELDAAADPSGAPLALEAVAEGGYGLRLITQLMSEVAYRRDGDRNTLTLTMKLGGPQPTARVAGAE